MPAPSAIQDLVERFDRNIDQYKKAQNETQVRREFIDPFFTELGWDMDNRQGAAPQYQDVIHEDQIKIGGRTKAPDYGFRIGGTLKFFVEAKKPSVYVKETPAPAYQVRSYAWSAKLPISIVTDFEEFAVYDCSQKPNEGDKPSVARINYLTYNQYIEKWDELYAIYSRDAILKGSFDKYAEGAKGKRGTTTVDKAFLQEIERFRELLAKNFAKNNRVSEDELKFAVQRTLDRIIFLRICESRGVEEEGRLLEAVTPQPPLLRGASASVEQRGAYKYLSPPSQGDDKHLTPTSQGGDKHLSPTSQGDDKHLTPTSQGGDKHLSPTSQSKYLSPPSQSKYLSPPSQSKYLSPPSQSKYLSPPSQSKYLSPPLQGGLGGASAYSRLFTLFHAADNRYNSGLFYFRKGDKAHTSDAELDTITPKLKLDDKILKDIVEHLYYPKSPYQFDVIPADILGQVYEQFLGKVIRMTPGGMVKIEEKPEVRKAGGVYYTPTYIVEYIVKNTVGKLIETRSIASLQDRNKMSLNVLDPACGSGSFLLGAYDYLLKWYLTEYAKKTDYWLKQKNAPIYRIGARENQPPNPLEKGAFPDVLEKGDQDFKTEKNQAPLYKGGWGVFALTTAERKRILLEHIYGVDIDEQAVEVAKLNLMLKCLEGESRQKQSKLSVERLLPDLSNNIKCGNSLIGPDFYSQLPLLDKERAAVRSNEDKKINAFDWNAEFPDIMSQTRRGEKGGGFDVVIGNPPWGANFEKPQKTYLLNRYPQGSDFESSQYFIIQGIKLLKKMGKLGLIIPNTFALNVFAKRGREYVAENSRISKIVDLSDVNVFEGPSVRSMILLSSLDYQEDKTIISIFKDAQTEKIVAKSSKSELSKLETWKELFEEVTPASNLVKKIMMKSQLISHVCDVKQGYIPYRTTTLTARFGAAKAKDIVSNRLWHSDKKESSDYQKELQGGDVSRYGLKWSGTWVKYGKWISTYLPMSVFSGPRLLIREITGKIPYSVVTTYTDDVYVHNPSVLAVLPKDRSIKIKFVLAVLNSKLLSLVFRQVAPKAKKGLFPKVIITDAKRLPIPKLNLSEKKDKIIHDTLVTLVDRMLSLNKELPQAKTPQSRTRLERQIAATDAEIDRLVYELYGLTEEEIKIVEGTN